MEMSLTRFSPAVDDAFGFLGGQRVNRDMIYVLHAFEKKTQATPKRDVAVAKERYAELLRGTP